MTPEENQDSLYKKHQNLANSLKLDLETSAKAWESYKSIDNNVCLEGDPLHWIACAIFAVCRTNSQGSNNTNQNNYVSLTNLLKEANLSLRQFFDKIEKWCDIANVSEDFFKMISDLKNKYSVAYNIFKYYLPTYMKIFKAPVESDYGLKHRNRKQSSPPCTRTQLYEFCWLFFITAKAEYPSCSVDLVISTHLLQACLDYIFKNAFLDDRRDLLNPDFDGLPSDWESADFQLPSTAPCIIDKLCDNVMVTEAKYVKVYTLTGIVKQLFNKGALNGDCENHIGILNPNYFEQNSKNLIKSYESILMHQGDFDERIFCTEYLRRIRSKSKIGSQIDTDDIENSRAALELPSRIPATPLTNRQYLGPRDQNGATGIDSMSQNIQLLQRLSQDVIDCHADILKDIYWKSVDNPTEKVDKVNKKLKEVIDKLSDRFRKNYVQENSDSTQGDPTDQRLSVAVKLFYKFFTSILKRELTLHQNISNIVNKDIFLESLFACCLEIVIFAYNSQREFPWILTALQIPAYHFLRVIELIVRAKDQLSRDLVKHLNTIEEFILDTELWKSESLFWESLEQEKEIPRYQEIALPGSILHTSRIPLTPQSAERLFVPASPGPSALTSFDSPVTSSIKKNLFSLIKPGQSVLNQNNQNTKATSNQAKSRSFNIICRKIYNLAAVRLDDLYNSLNVKDEMRALIWTLFEHCLRTNTTMFKDRNLDQILICSFYCVCKYHQVHLNDDPKIMFVDIFDKYRLQPQALSSKYRKVIVYRKGEKGPKGEVLQDNINGDLIEFYNNIFVFFIEPYMAQSQNLNLSPMPYVRSMFASPIRQITDKVTVRRLESPGGTLISGNSFIFSRSSTEELRNINKAVEKDNLSRKRLSDQNSYMDEPYGKKFYKMRLVPLMEERNNHTAE